jgi:hypothetical protein
MGKEHGLSALKVRVTGHDRIGMLGGDVDERIAQTDDSAGDLDDRALRPQPHIVDDLVVAAATGVQLPGDRADQFPQSPFDASVDIFIGNSQVKLAGPNFVEDPPQPIFDLTCFIGRNYSLSTEHPDVCDRTTDVFSNESDIERDRGVERFEPGIWRSGKSSAPCFRSIYRCRLLLCFLHRTPFNTSKLRRQLFSLADIISCEP